MTINLREGERELPNIPLFINLFLHSKSASFTSIQGGCKDSVLGAKIWARNCSLPFLPLFFLSTSISIPLVRGTTAGD